MQSESFWSVLGRMILVVGALMAYRWWRGDFEEKPQLDPEIKFDWREATKGLWKDSPYLLPAFKVAPKKDESVTIPMNGFPGRQPWRPAGDRPFDPEVVRKWLEQHKAEDSKTDLAPR